ncbi:MAG: NADH-quinone oxidoreductase subunit NuoF [Spirochaetales bacterium]|nr:NADH-quinone oxidoreductase subunit NuoF [Spirochaetales bacterium]
MDHSVTPQYKIILCWGSSCQKLSSKSILDRIHQKIDELKMGNNVDIILSGCLGMCSKGPILIINPGYYIYGKITPEIVGEIIEKHINQNKATAAYLIEEDHLFNRFYRIFGDVKFYGRQMRIALRNCGIIDPESIDDYLSVRGYESLAKSLALFTPNQVINEIKASGLRGRGGAGFPTGYKWELTAQEKSSEKFIICNADEGDPGAFMDRNAIESDPHTIIEGMIIGAYAVGAQNGIIYTRAEYPLAIDRLHIAINQAKEHGFLGNNILGTNFSFNIEIRQGAGAFICGEETALIHSLEGKRGVPRTRPPYPATKGLFNKPTVVNNVETWANIPVIIQEGAAWFSSIGTKNSKGTKVFAVAGSVINTGLVEVPMGTTLKEIIFDICGGLPDNKTLKAVQIGGPSGGCLTKDHLDIQVDYESFAEIGTIMGSGGMIVIDNKSCMVKLARFFLEFSQSQSCGKCTPCREGTKRMLEILERITTGNGKPEDIQKLLRLGNTIKKTALCGLGKSAPNPVISTITHFRNEYEEHINEKKCATNDCSALIVYEINDACTGCSACIRICPTKAISGIKKNKHQINQNLCIKCGDCFDICAFKGITRR